MANVHQEIEIELKKLANEEKRNVLMRFFKTGPGQYGEGDQFLGVTVPKIRSLIRPFLHLSLDDLTNILGSPIHEMRLLSLLIMVKQMEKASLETQTQIFNTYLSNTHNVNNWDLVDLSAPNIVGKYLYENGAGDYLENLVCSEFLWERRISVLATFYFIKNNRFEHTLNLSKQLLLDEHDLIHKAVGWMLREVGKRDFDCEKEFLVAHYKTMPRTMLRYAIEKFPEPLRQDFLKGRI